MPMTSLLSVILLSCCSFVASSANVEPQANMPTQPSEVLASEKSNEDSILMHLKMISKIQSESKHIRDSVRKDREEKAQRGEAERQQMADEYEAMVKIADNTKQNILTDDWNVYGTITFLLAVVALLVSWWSYIYTRRTYVAQVKTEQHTTNAPIEVQLGTLDDMSRHFYRNLVCTCAIILKHKFGPHKGTVYPSESNLKKLQTLADEVVLPIDVDTDKEDNAYQHMHELKVLLRNYNVEVEVASDHLSRKGIMAEALQQDFRNILYKPLFLTRNTFDFKKSLQKNLEKGYEPGFVREALTRMIREHFKKLFIPDNFRQLFQKETTDYLSKLMRDDAPDFSAIDTYAEVDRSVDYLLDYVKDDDRAQVATISSDPFKSNSLDILSIANQEEFTEFCLNRHFIADDDEGSEKSQVLYPHILPYLNYLHQPTWEVHTVLKYILAVDAAIETNRIGMVNYL